MSSEEEKKGHIQHKINSGNPIVKISLRSLCFGQCFGQCVLVSVVSCFQMSQFETSLIVYENLEVC